MPAGVAVEDAPEGRGFEGVEALPSFLHAYLAELQAAVSQDPVYAAAVSEYLTVHSPMLYVTRQGREPVELHVYKVNKTIAASFRPSSTWHEVYCRWRSRTPVSGGASLASPAHTTSAANLAALHAWTLNWEGIFHVLGHDIRSSVGVGTEPRLALTHSRLRAAFEELPDVPPTVPLYRGMSREEARAWLDGTTSLWPFSLTASSQATANFGECVRVLRQGAHVKCISHASACGQEAEFVVVPPIDSHACCVDDAEPGRLLSVELFACFSPGDASHSALASDGFLGDRGATEGLDPGANDAVEQGSSLSIIDEIGTALASSLPTPLTPSKPDLPDVPEVSVLQMKELDSLPVVQGDTADLRAQWQPGVDTPGGLSGVPHPRGALDPRFPVTDILPPDFKAGSFLRQPPTEWVERIPRERHAWCDDSSDDEEVEPSQPELDGTASCTFCGSVTNLVQCCDTQRWFCNNRNVVGASCAILQLRLLSIDGKVFSIQLHPSSRWGPVAIRCSKGETDLRRIGVVEHTLPSSDDPTVRVVSAVQVVGSHSAGDLPFHPAIQGEHSLAPWICASEVTAGGAASTARDRVERRLRGNESCGTPVQFADVGAYLTHFTRLVALAAAHEAASSKQSKRDGVVLTWKPDGLQGPVACFKYNTGGSDDLSLDGLVRITHEAIPSRSTTAEPRAGEIWMANGVVTAVESASGIVAVALLSCTTGLTAIDYHQTAGYSVLAVAPAVSHERMQTAIGNFAYDDVTGCSSAVQQAILGNGDVSLPIAIRAVDSPPPSFPEPTDAQTAAIAGSLTNSVYLIVGPPGTGKTTTTVHIVWAFVRQRQGPVLVCAPSNAAANHLARRLHAVKLQVVRVYSESREALEGQDMPREVLLESYLQEGSALAKYRTMKQELGALTDVDQRAYDKERRKLRAELLRVDVVVCTCSATYGATLTNMRFNNVVVDEAGQAVEPEAIMPITRGAQRVTLVGDSKQLGPVVKCRRAARDGLSLSLFERLQECGTPHTFLDVQFRMHPAIAEFPSSQFYDGHLRSAASTQSNVRRDVQFPWPSVEAPVLFWHVRDASGEQRGGRDGTSCYNLREVDAVTACVRRLLDQGVEPAEVGVISMYDAQRSAIAASLRSAHAAEVKVANVDAFQGQERVFIILSLTRSNARRELGHVKDPRRVNVALTRAQCGLVVIGDAVTAAAGSDIWSNFLRHLGTRAVFEGQLDALVPFSVPGLRAQSAQTVTEETYVANCITSDQYVASTFTAHSRSAPAHALERARDRVPLERRGRYSRFTRLPSERFEHARLLRKQDPYVACRQPSFVHWPVAGPSLLGVLQDGASDDVGSILPPDLIGQLYCRCHYRPADRVSDVVELGEHLWRSGVSLDKARRALEVAFPRLAELGLDMTGPYLVGETLDGQQQISEEAIHCEAFVAAGIDLLEPSIVEAMTQLLHSAQFSSAATIRAERELLTTTLHRLSIQAEHSLRMVQYFWRMRIVGTAERRADDVDYWTFVHSTRPESAAQLTDLITRRRNSVTGRGVLIRRHFTCASDGSVIPAKVPVETRVTRYMLLDTETGRAARDEHGALVVYRQECTAISVAAVRRRTYDSNNKLVVAPFTYIHRFRPVRNMLCGYGALACLHTLRRDDGSPVLDGNGNVVRVRFMATHHDFAVCAQRTEDVTRWYLQVRAAFARLYPEALLLLYYGNPGGGGEAALQLGLNAVLVDVDTSDARPYFENVAPQLYGPHGPRVSVVNGDALAPEVRRRAESSHPTANATDTWLVSSSPPCIRGSTIVEIRVKADARARDGDKPPGRGDLGKSGARSEVLGEEIAIRHSDYVNRGVRYMIETTAGNHCDPPDGGCVVEWDELLYGGRLQGRHKMFTPADQPFVIDEALHENVRHLRPRICPGAARVLQPRQRAGGGPIKPSCCRGNMPCMYNNGFRIYDRAALCQFCGTHPSHVKDKGKFNNMVSVPAQRHQQAQSMAWSVQSRSGLPFVSHTDATRDPRIGAWWLGLIDLIAQPARSPPLPVLRALILCAPSSMPGQFLADARTGLLPSVTVPARGALVPNVISAFEATYAGVYLYDTRLVFLCDFLWATAPCVVFFTSSIPGNDQYFLQRREEQGASEDQPEEELKSDRAQLKTAPLTVSSLEVGKREFHMIQALTLIKAEQLGFIGPGITASEVHNVNADSTKFAQRARHAVDVDAIGLEHVRDVLSPGVSQSQQSAAALASTRQAATAQQVCDTWTPPPGADLIVQTQAEAETDTCSALAESAFQAKSLDTASREQYVKLRSALFGNVAPQKFGLGDKKADQLSDPSAARHRPGAVDVAAVGLLVKWKTNIVVAARNGVYRCMLHKALVGQPARPASKNQPASDPPLLKTELALLLTSWLGGRTLCKEVTNYVERALQSEPQPLSWIIPARDSTGVLLAHSVPPTRVNLQVWSVSLADDADWAPFDVQPGPPRQLAVHLPLEAGGVAALEQGSLHLVSRRYAATPSFVPSTPYSVNTLSFATPARLQAEYEALHLQHFAEFIQIVANTPSAACSAVVTWPAIEQTRHRYDAIDWHDEDQAAEAAWIRDYLMLLKAAAALHTLKQEVTLSCPDARRYPFIPVYCNGTVFEDIRCGDKSVESRLMWGPYALVQVGWLLCIRRNLSSAALWVIVTEIHRHNSFHEAARFHGASLFPRLDLPELTDAQIGYACYCMYHPSPSQRNPSTLRKWLVTTATPGCVVCWTVRRIPAQCSLVTPSGFGGLAAHSMRPIHRRTGRARWLRFVRGFHSTSFTISEGFLTLEIALSHSLTVPALSERERLCNQTTQGLEQQAVSSAAEERCGDAVRGAASSSPPVAASHGAPLSFTDGNAQLCNIGYSGTLAGLGSSVESPAEGVAVAPGPSVQSAAALLRNLPVLSESAHELTESQQLIAAQEDEQAVANSLATLQAEQPALHTALVSPQVQAAQEDTIFDVTDVVAVTQQCIATIFEQVLNNVDALQRQTAWLKEHSAQQRPGSIRHCVRPTGIADPSLGVQYIVTFDCQCDARAGTVVTLPTVPGPTRLRFNVGSALQSGSHVQQTRASERAPVRLAAFQRCLAELRSCIDTPSSIAFPWSGGCSARKEWPAWRAAIKSFADAHPTIRITIVQRPEDMVKQAKNRTVAALRAERDKAKCAFDDADPAKRRVAMQLLNALHAQCLASIPDNLPWHEASKQQPTIAAAAAATFAASSEDTAERVATARANLTSENQAVDDAFADDVRARLAAGDATIADVWEARATIAGSYNSAQTVRVLNSKRVILVGLFDRQYNGRTGVTDNTVRKGRVRVYLDKPLGNPYINVKQQHLLDSDSAEALIAENSL